MIKKYKFRAECYQDIIALALKLDSDNVKSIEVVEPQVCEIVVEKGYKKELKKAIESVPDGHVMMETFKPVEKYTGERFNFTHS